jgi:SAM-dependent methyltransferase
VWGWVGFKSLTVDLAARVAPGTVVGIDPEPAVIAEASTRAETSGDLAAVQFRTGDVYSLVREFPPESFDVVHAHQVLQHLTEPVVALEQMRSVLRDDGILAIRDSDYAAFVWEPSDPLLDRWMELYHGVCARNGADADAGRHLPGWARAARFSQIRASSSTWTFTEAADRRWWGELWAARVTRSALAEQAVEYGLSSIEELDSISAAWRRWSEADDGIFVVVHVEVLARR